MATNEDMLLVLLCLSRSENRVELVRSVREVVEPRGLVTALTRPAELERLLEQILPTLLVVDYPTSVPAGLPVLRFAPATSPTTLSVAVRDALGQVDLDARSGRMFAARRRGRVQ